MSPEPATTLHIKSMEIPGFSLVEEIGRGGMASVYLAVQESLRRRVALKVMLPTLANDPTFRERFANEGLAIAKLSHPNIVIIYDIGSVGDCHYISMEYLGHGNLKDRIARGMSLPQTVAVTLALVKAIGQAHAQGIIHRDIKAMNVLFRDEDTPVLTDFGIAKLTQGSSGLIQAGFMFGTPQYMSPEQARGQPADRRSDLYSLGVLFYEMLTGTLPYQSDDPLAIVLMHLKEPLPVLPQSLGFFQPILDRLMAKEADERYASAEEVAADLEAVATTHISGLDENDFGIRIKTPTLPPGHGLRPVVTGHISVPPTTKVLIEPTRVSETRRPSWWLWPILGLVGVSLLGGVLYFFRPSGDSGAPSQQRMALLQDQAERQLAASQRIEPVGNNAAETYREMLAMTPGYEPALTGLQRIGYLYLSEAQESFRLGKLDPSLDSIGRGLKAVPGHQGLLKLKVEVEREREIRRWLGLAEEQQRLGRLVEPAGDNALESYKRLLELVPEEPRALDGRRRIAELLLTEARKYMEQGEWETAQERLRQGRLAANLAESASLQMELLARQEQARQPLVSPPAGEPSAPQPRPDAPTSHGDRQLPTATTASLPPPSPIDRSEKLDEEAVQAVSAPEQPERDLPAAVQQRALKALGYYKGTVTEEKNPEMLKANRAFQHELGERSDGELTLEQKVGLITRAALKGHSASQTDLGWMYATGVGVARDPLQAGRCFFAAATQGHQTARRNLGKLMEKYPGVGDAHEPESWRKAEKGTLVVTIPSSVLGEVLKALNKPTSAGEIAVEERVALVLAAAEQGQKEAQNLLGIWFGAGIGMVKDAKESVAWFRKAAAQGSAGAYYNLAISLLEGTGVAKDPVEAKRLLRMAADAEDGTLSEKAKKRLKALP